MLACMCYMMVMMSNGSEVVVFFGSFGVCTKIERIVINKILSVMRYGIY